MSHASFRTRSAIVIVAAGTCFAASAQGQTRPASVAAQPEVRATNSPVPPPRLMKPPKPLNAAQVRSRIAGMSIPNLRADFSLTPAVPQVAGRGTMTIDGRVTVPDPLPPGFPGEAEIRYEATGWGAATLGGGITIKFKAEKNVFYAIDCVTGFQSGENVIFRISGAGAEQNGTIKAVGGHSIFNVRRTTDTGMVTLFFRPDRFEPKTALAPEKNVMDFWGCHFSSGS